MTKEEYIEYWLKSSKDDLGTMKYLFKGKRYVHALFFGHLYIEKISKSLWIKNNKENYPPRIHNILTILQQAKIILDEEYLLFLLKLNQYQVEGRYPEDIEKLYKITNRKLTLQYITTIKTIAQCLLNKLP
jgi:HEPN domain-containing protein